MKNKLKYIFNSCIIFLVLMIHSSFRNSYITFLTEKPLSEETILILKNNDSYLKYYSKKYNIPIEALSSAIGCEVNRRIYTNRLIDLAQDYIFSTKICSNEFLKLSLNSNIETRYLNFSKQDIGIGNIQVETAWIMYNLYPKEFININNIKDLTNYLLTIKGNIHVASLVIMYAQNLFSKNKYYNLLDRQTKSAVLYSYYKQGHEYYERYILLSNGKRAPIPGGGMDIIQKLNIRLYK